MILVTGGVKRLIFNSLSRKIVAISVPARRLFISLLICES